MGTGGWYTGGDANEVVNAAAGTITTDLGVGYTATLAIGVSANIVSPKLSLTKWLESSNGDTSLSPLVIH